MIQVIDSNVNPICSPTTEHCMKNRPFQLPLHYIYSVTDHVKAIKQKKDFNDCIDFLRKTELEIHKHEHEVICNRTDP